MATLNFIKGTIHGKLGEFVGSSWKGKDYIKTYTPPSDPKTQDQTAVRTVFQHIMHIASAINPTVLKPYTFPRPRRMTAVNRMAQINQPMFADKQWDAAKLKIFEGSLLNPGVTSAEVSADGLTVTATWDGAQGSAEDAAIAVLHDETSERSVALVTKRNAGTTGAWDIAEIGGIADPAKAHIYLVFSQPPAPGTGGSGEVSNTAYHAITRAP
jgi:hypothetical protein